MKGGSCGIGSVFVIPQNLANFLNSFPNMHYVLHLLFFHKSFFIVELFKIRGNEEIPVKWIF